MSPPEVIVFSLGDIGNACDDCAARILKEELARLIQNECDERKEKGASLITLTDMVTGAVLQIGGFSLLDDAKLMKMAREFVSHPRIKLYPYRPLALMIHAFYRP